MSTPVTRTWPYGTTKRAKLVDQVVGVQFLVDEDGEGHVLALGCGDGTAKNGDTGTLTFTQGGPTGGYWQFTKD